MIELNKPTVFWPVLCIAILLLMGLFYLCFTPKNKQEDKESQEGNDLESGMGSNSDHDSQTGLIDNNNSSNLKNDHEGIKQAINYREASEYQNMKQAAQSVIELDKESVGAHVLVDAYVLLGEAFVELGKKSKSLTSTEIQEGISYLRQALDLGKQNLLAPNRLQTI